MLFEALDRVLPTEDADISKVAGRALSKQNIEIHTGTLVQDVAVRRRLGHASPTATSTARPTGS